MSSDEAYGYQGETPIESFDKPSEKAVPDPAFLDAYENEPRASRPADKSKAAPSSQPQSSQRANSRPVGSSAPAPQNPYVQPVSFDRRRYRKRQKDQGPQRVRPVETQYRQSTFQGYDPTARPYSRRGVENGMGVKDTAAYNDMSRYRAKRRTKKPVSKAAIVIAVVIVAVIGVGAWFYMNPPTFNATINGMEVTLNRGTTLNDLITDEVVAPQAGDLLAVDGSVLEVGGGDAFSAQVNDSTTNDGGTVLHKDDVVTVSNGADTTEPTTQTTVEVPAEYESGGVGAVHSYFSGQNGTSNRLTGTISGLTVDEVVTPPVNGGFKKYNVDTNGEKVIALTFDDGPWQGTTSQILDILKQNNAKATFFTIGNQIEGNEDVVKQAADAGHQICTHSWDHADGSGQGVNLTYMTPEEQISEIQKGYDAITQATGQTASTVIRAPGGNYYGDIIDTLQPYVTAEIGWNIDTEDWRRPGASTIAERIKSVQPGEIILMHDGGGDRSQTVEALKTALPYLNEQGYKFVTIDELLKYVNPADINVEES